MNGELATDYFDSPVMKYMSFWPSFIRDTYSFKDIISSPDLVE